jgi:hypothetical protein
VRLALLLAVLLAAPAHADLYRWRDPQTGSIKYSNHPPPWYGDPVREIGSPPVEVVPDLSPRAAAAPPKDALAKPAAKQGPGALSNLEAQFGTLLQFFKQMPQSTDFDRTGAALQQQADMYRAVAAELDRQDPAGAARRRAMAQESGILDQLKKGLEALSSTKPPAQR